MNKKFKTVIFVGLILFVILMNVSVYASDDSFDLNLKENTNSLLPGSTLSLEMRISNINVSEGEKGISGFTANLSFDDSIFEYEKIKAENENWNVSYDNKHIVAYREKTDVLTNSSSEVTESGIVGTINLKVKDDAKAGTTKVKLENIEGGDASHSFPGNTNELDIQITEKEPALSSIEIVTNPDKTTYKVGEKFDPTGLEVLANFEDDTTALITDFTYTPDGELTKDDTIVTISYTKNGVTKETNIEISVKSEEVKETEDTGDDTKKDSNIGTKSSSEKETKNETGTNVLKANSKDTSTANKVLPKTGKYGIIAIVVAISIVLVVSTIKYRKYKGF